MTHADWATYLEMYKPSVCLVERIEKAVGLRPLDDVLKWALDAADTNEDRAWIEGVINARAALVDGGWNDSKILPEYAAEMRGA